jgi:uncharacterized OsmC-like protein
MQLEVVGETHVRLTADKKSGLIIDGQPFGPVQMLAASLAMCTAAVLHDYAQTAQFQIDPFVVDVQWSYAEQPRRIAQMQMQLEVGPNVPPSRQQALLRAAEHCTVHNSLQHGVRVATTLEVPGVTQA